VRSVLYFHGFASSPASAKVQALSRLLEPDGISLNAPDLNAPSFGALEWESMIETALAAGRRIPPDAIAGSSLGGLVALEVMRRGIVAPLVLIAPALGIAERWRTKLPPGDPIEVFNHALGAPAPIHRRFFLEMADLHVDDAPPPAPVTLIMGTNDESVPFDGVLRRWQSWEPALAAGSKFVRIENGDHGLTQHVDRIADEIRGALRRALSA
jgi:fermentation-respiration switch protein FrsA (DUF1100 family)